ncbi:MAG: S24/S26 family peptidase [Bacteroidales bacterium]|nr:S24/S26 family peptidase [Bacteroidales bacterium]
MTIIDEAARLLEEGRQVMIPVSGVSMRPWLRPGLDLVTLAPPEAEVMRVGAIVLARYTAEHPYVMHRIVAVDGEELTLMGDGNIQARERVKRADVVGVAVAAERRGRQRRLDTAAERRKGRLWLALRPLRRYLLFILKWGS